MDLTRKYLSVEGIKAGISLKVDSSFIEALPFIFSHWPYELKNTAACDIFATVELKKDGWFYLTSPFMKGENNYLGAVNVVCALVAELAWQRLREDPSLLCIHGAAAEFGSRLVVFPATRKAGKSTLSVAMAAAGIRIFTDDFLPVSIEDDGIIRGEGSGVSPRLRLPLPAQIGRKAKEFMAQRPLLSNTQYTYVKPRQTESARFGETKPLGGFVFLERADGIAAQMAEISKAQALKTLIYQNFSRAGHAGDILAMLEFAAMNLPCYLLKYDQTEPAIALLQKQFSDWGTSLPQYFPRAKLGNEAAQGVVPFHRFTDVTFEQFEHANGVQVVAADGKRFLTGRNGQSIHYLNEGAALIWQILKEPASVDETVNILLAAFPEQARVSVEKDVLRCFEDFGKNGLLRKIDRAPEHTASNADLIAP